jgi:hypothetical protein
MDEQKVQIQGQLQVSVQGQQEAQQQSNSSGPEATKQIDQSSTSKSKSSH